MGLSQSVLWAQMTKVPYFHWNRHSGIYWCISGNLSIWMDASITDQNYSICVNDLPICVLGLQLWFHEDVMRTVLHSTIEVLSLVLWGWRSCSVSRMSPFFNDQTGQCGTIRPLLCSKNCLKGSSPCPFCFRYKLGSRDVWSAGFLFAGRSASAAIRSKGQPVL